MTSESRLPFNPYSLFRYYFRKFRNVFLILLLIGVGIEIYGIPFLRWEYKYHGSHDDPVFISGEYISPVGWKSVQANQYADGCPLILWLPLNRPVYEHAFDIVRHGLHIAQDTFLNASFSQDDDND